MRLVCAALGCLLWSLSACTWTMAEERVGRVWASVGDVVGAWYVFRCGWWRCLGASGAGSSAHVCVRG